MDQNIELCGIYRITAPSGSMYIGMTLDSFESRWKGHKKELKSGRHKCIGLLRAFSKYGIESFNWEILEILAKDDLQKALVQEQAWWDHFHQLKVNLYNGRPSGKGSVFHSKETKAAISAAMPNKAQKVKVPCKTCGKEFEKSLTKAQGKKVFCSSICANRAPRVTSGLSTRISKDDILKMAEDGLLKKAMAEKLNISLQSVCDLHSFYGIKTPRPKRSKIQFEKICCECKILFVSRKESAKFCSRTCYRPQNKNIR